MKFDISISTEDEESLMEFDEDLLAAILTAKQKKFALETDGGIWVPIDLTRENAFHILRSVLRGVEELGGKVSVKKGLTYVMWSDPQAAV
jgi:hypothetical protein